MIHSTATRYAIRAVCLLAERPPDGCVHAREISEVLGVPYHSLSKILQDLARKRILSSTKGPGGGFRLSRSPDETTLYTLIEAVEGPIRDDECMLGLDLCSDETACPMHNVWKTFKTTFRDKMQSISLADVVRAAERKRQVRA